MATLVPDAIPTPVPGEPSGAGTYIPNHPYYVSDVEPTVWDDAVSLWLLDEASGTRADSIGSNDLTDNNTVLYKNMGPSGVAGDFVAASSESLSRTYSTIDTSLGVTWAAWVFADIDPANSHFFHNGGQHGSSDYMAIGGVGAANRWFARAGSSAADTVSVECPLNPVPIGTWHFLTFQYDPATKKIRAGIDAVFGAWSTALAAHPVPTEGIFIVGGGVITNSPALFLDGKMSRVGWWNENLDDSTIASIYNAGVGKAYADLTADEKVGLVSYWNLDEASGNRADSHGSNTLTDNNTVLSATNSYPANLPGRVASFVAANSESLSLASQTVMPESTVRSLSFWFKTSDVTQVKGILGVGNTAQSGTPNFFFRLNGSVLSLYSGIDGGAAHDYKAGSTTLTNNTWYHVVYVYSDPGWEVYLNGSLEISDVDGQDGAAFEDANLYFGVAFPGFITQLLSATAVWNRVIDSSEIAELYNSGDGAVLP